MDKDWKIRDWALKERLDKERSEEWSGSEAKLEVIWNLAGQSRPRLGDDSSLRELEDEIDWIQDTLVGVLDKHVRRITICARSKRWWKDRKSVV